MTEDEKMMVLVRQILEEKAQEAVKNGADPTLYDLGFPIYRQDESYEVGEIRRDPVTNQPFECLIDYDGGIHPDWDLSVPTLWKPYHGKDRNHAYPWALPSGAHDLYKAGEFMTYTDGFIYKCLSDTAFAPDQAAVFWEKQTKGDEGNE